MAPLKASVAHSYYYHTKKELINVLVSKHSLRDHSTMLHRQGGHLPLSYTTYNPCYWQHTMKGGERTES